jgi:beta-galactosidase
MVPSLSHKFSMDTFFDTTEALDFYLVLQGDGCILGSGSLNVPTLAPQTSHLINMESSPWFALWSTCAVKEVFLSVSVKQRYQTPWAKDGHLLASAQLSLPQKMALFPMYVSLA